jgi:glycerol uptake facilitator-like aquaporin
LLVLFGFYCTSANLGETVKKFSVTFATAVVLVSVVSAQAAPAVVPEPSSSAQLVVGLLVVAGLALVARKYASRPEAE